MKLFCEMQEVGAPVESGPLQALMQTFVSASRFEEGFRLLAQIEAKAYGVSQYELYGICYILQSTLREKGDQKAVEGVEKVQKTIEDLGIISNLVEARALVSGKELNYKTGCMEPEFE